MFIVRFNVMAKDLMHARRKVRTMEPDDIYVNQSWVEGKNQHLAEAIGFHEMPDEWEEDDVPLEDT